jgi:hypothetical protein
VDYAHVWPPEIEEAKRRVEFLRDLASLNPSPEPFAGLDPAFATKSGHERAARVAELAMRHGLPEDALPILAGCIVDVCNRAGRPQTPAELSLLRQYARRAHDALRACGRIPMAAYRAGLDRGLAERIGHVAAAEFAAISLKKGSFLDGLRILLGCIDDLRSRATDREMVPSEKALVRHYVGLAIESIPRLGELDVKEEERVEYRELQALDPEGYRKAMRSVMRYVR